MKTKSVLTLIFCLSFFQLFAQEYKIGTNNQSKLVIDELNKVIVEGYDGSEVIFTVANGHHEPPERAKGLKAVSGLGLEDNTGIGLSVKNEGNEITVQQISRKGGASYKIRVPKSISISYHHSTPWGEKISLKDISGELELSTVHNSIDMENVTGPMTVKTVHGEITTEFSNTIKGPISIISTHGILDVSLPASTKANLQMIADHGEMYTDMDIQFDKSDEELRKLSSSVVKGTLNGGGQLTIELSSSHGNIYLRKQ